MEQNNYILVETKELTCLNCCFGKTNRCERPDDLLDCEQDIDDGNLKHFIYREKDETNTYNNKTTEGF